MAKKCELCRKKIEICEKECDETGFAWHCYCFRCCVCGHLLNEKDFNLRGDQYNQLFCKSHALFEKNRLVPCKAYFVSTAYRVVF